MAQFNILGGQRVNVKMLNMFNTGFIILLFDIKLIQFPILNHRGQLKEWTDGFEKYLYMEPLSLRGEERGNVVFYFLCQRCGFSMPLFLQRLKKLQIGII